MSVLAETQARMASAGKLKSVVEAMRGIAAAHAQQARSQLKGYRAYADVISDGIGRASELIDGNDREEPGKTQSRSAVVVFAAEHGLAGAFSERVLDRLGEPKPSELMLVGTHGAALARQRGLRVDWAAPMSSHASGVEGTARRVADALYAEFAAGRLNRAEVMFAEGRGAAGSEIVRRSILPIDPRAFARAPSGEVGTGSPPESATNQKPGAPLRFNRSDERSSRHAGPAPLVNLAPGRLIEQLAGEHIFAQLALAALESFVAENAARLTTMDAARRNIDQKLSDLTVQERLQRQEEITAEVQEVTFGALAS